MTYNVKNKVKSELTYLVFVVHILRSFLLLVPMMHEFIFELRIRIGFSALKIT